MGDLFDICCIKSSLPKLFFSISTPKCCTKTPPTQGAMLKIFQKCALRFTRNLLGNKFSMKVQNKKSTFFKVKIANNQNSLLGGGEAAPHRAIHG